MESLEIIMNVTMTTDTVLGTNQLKHNNFNYPEATGIRI